MPEVLTLREIDAVIAELVMGWKWCNRSRNRLLPAIEHGIAVLDRGTSDGKDPECEDAIANVPQFTTDAVASYALRQKMRELGWSYSLEHVIPDLDRASFFKAEPDGEFEYADGATEMLAVALACCAALGRPVEVKP